MSVFAKGGSEQEKVTRFVAGGLISIVSLVVGGLTGGLFWVMAMTRWLGPVKFGLLGPVFQFFWLMCMISSLGLGQAITTFVSHHWEKKPEEAKAFLSLGNRVLLWQSLVVLTLGGLVGLAAFLGLLSKVWAAIALTVAPGIAVTILFWGLNATLTGFQRMDLVAVGNMIFPVGMFAGSAALVLGIQAWRGKETYLDVAGAAAGMFFGGLAAYACAFFFMRRLGFGLRGIYLTTAKRSVGSLLRFGGASAAALVLHTLLVSLAPILVFWLAKLGFFGATKEANMLSSGYFSTAHLYAQAPMMLMGVTFALLPAISEAHAAGNHRLMQRYYDLALKISFAITVPLIFSYVAFGGRIVEVLSGEGYPAQKLHAVVAVVSLGFLGLALIFMLVHLFMGLKVPAVAAWTLGGGALIYAASIPLLGYLLKDPVGAAAGFAFSALSAAAALIILLRAKFNLQFRFRNLLVPLACCFSATVAFFAVRFWSEHPALLGLAVVAGYTVCSLLVGGVDEEDVEFLQGAFPGGLPPWLSRGVAIVQSLRVRLPVRRS